MSKLVRVDKKTYKELKKRSKILGVPMSTQIRFKVFGEPAKVKRLCE